MNSERDKPADQGDAPNAASRQVLRIPTALLWLGACLAALILLAAVLRSRQQVYLPVHWSEHSGAVTHDGQAAAARGPAGAARLDLGADDSLAALGPGLDDPRFGQAADTGRLDPDRVIPIERRWEFLFAPGLTESQYRGHLAALDIELGILNAAGTIQYLRGWGTAEVTRRTATWSSERRPYWSWGRGDLRQAEVILLKNSGVDVTDEILLHFLADETVTQLTRLEQEFAERKPQDILRTQFALKRTFRGYEASVADQEER